MRDRSIASEQEVINALREKAKKGLDPTETKIIEFTDRIAVLHHSLEDVTTHESDDLRLALAQIRNLIARRLAARIEPEIWNVNL